MSISRLSQRTLDMSGIQWNANGNDHCCDNFDDQVSLYNLLRDQLCTKNKKETVTHVNK